MIVQKIVHAWGFDTLARFDQRYCPCNRTGAFIRGNVADGKGSVGSDARPSEISPDKGKQELPNRVFDQFLFPVFIEWIPWFLSISPDWQKAEIID